MGEDKTGLDQVGSCALVVRIFFAKVNQDSEVERSQQTHEDYDICCCSVLSHITVSLGGLSCCDENYSKVTS